MIINNNKDSISVFVDEDPLYANALYSIHKVDISNCSSATPTYSGELDSSGFGKFSVPDGTYEVRIFPLTVSVEEFKQRFIVFYNQLPQMVEYTREVLCDTSVNCGDCQEGSETILQETFFKLMVYLLCTGLFYTLLLTRKETCAISKKIEQAEKERDYYGRFHFDFSKRIKDFFSIFYAELYSLHEGTIIGGGEDTLKEVFRKEEIESCLLSQGYDFDDIVCQVINVNCGCNG